MVKFSAKIYNVVGSLGAIIIWADSLEELGERLTDAIMTEELPFPFSIRVDAVTNKVEEGATKGSD